MKRPLANHIGPRHVVAIIAICSGALLSAFRPAHAQGWLQVGLDYAGSVSGVGGLPAIPITTVFARMILFLLGLVAVLTLGALVTGGIMYIVSLGDENRVQRAKRIILYGIIGLIVTMTSFTLLYIMRLIFAVI